MKTSQRLKEAQKITRVLVNADDPRYVRYLLVCDDPDKTVLPHEVLALQEEARRRGANVDSLILDASYFCLS